MTTAMPISSTPIAGTYSLSEYYGWVNVWLKDVPRDLINSNEVSLRVMRQLCARLVANGWTVTSDPYIDKNYPTLSRFRRYGSRGDLEFKAEATGIHAKIEFYQNRFNVEHPHGGYYDYDKLGRMPYVMRLRARYDMAALARKCAELGLVDKTERKGRTAAEEVERKKAECWHRNSPIAEYNRRGRDGLRLDNGMVAYYRDHAGHLHRGVLRHNLNNMWWVIENADRFWNVAAFDLFAFDPSRDRHRRDMRKVAARRVSEALTKAVKEERFERAARLRDVRNRMLAAGQGGKHV